ncbi:hypothetical protein ACLOJK_013023 [Asimina triloba]
MGALHDARLDEELENGIKLGLLELGSDTETETAAIEDAVKVLLEGLGEDPTREGLRKTPLRVAKSLLEGTKGYRRKVEDIVHSALFPEAGLGGGIGHAGGAGGLVVVRDIDLFSYCESCLLPFKVQCHVGYIPSGQRVVGLSKLSRVADVFAKRLQDPQRLANEVCSALHNSIKPAGVAVTLQCWHIPFPSPERSSVNLGEPAKREMQGWAQISVSSGSGDFEDPKSDSWGDFSALLKFRGVNVQQDPFSSSNIQAWCPSRAEDVPTCNGHVMKNQPNGKILYRIGSMHPAMVSAVASILHSLGENPLRRELVGTPHRFVRWLMNFKRSSMEMKLNGFSYSQAGPHNLAPHSRAGHNSSTRSGIRSELNLPFWSQCEHHLLPFHGVAHVSYFHAEESETVKRSVLQTIVHFHGCKLQVQERLTRQIAEAVSSIVGESVMVVVEANHICMISRGIEKVGSNTATIAVLGRFSTEPAAKAMFLQTISNSTFSWGRT